jgi:hypothetical protein
MEPRASTPVRRLSAIEALTEAGIPTWVNASPMIPALNDHELEGDFAGRPSGRRVGGQLHSAAPAAGGPRYLQELAGGALPRALPACASVLRSMRGGADYDARWGKRMEGTGPFAQVLAKRFKLVTSGWACAPTNRICVVTGFLAMPRKKAQLDLFGEASVGPDTNGRQPKLTPVQNPCCGPLISRQPECAEPGLDRSCPGRQHRLVGFENLHVFRAVAIGFLGHGPQRVAFFHRVEIGSTGCVFRLMLSSTDAMPSTLPAARMIFSRSSWLGAEPAITTLSPSTVTSTSPSRPSSATSFWIASAGSSSAAKQFLARIAHKRKKSHCGVLSISPGWSPRLIRVLPR